MAHEMLQLASLLVLLLNGSKALQPSLTSDGKPETRGNKADKTAGP